MKLKDLLEGVACEIVQGGPEAEVSAIHFDSRKVGKGDVFVAQRGVSVDGHAFIGKAIAGGAIAVVCEEVPENLPEGIVVVKTANSSEALGWMALRASVTEDEIGGSNGNKRENDNSDVVVRGSAFVG